MNLRNLLSSRLQELKAVLADRSRTTPSEHPKVHPSSGSTLASNPPGVRPYPTPVTTSGPSRGDQTLWNVRRPRGLSSDDSSIPRRQLIEDGHMNTSDEENVPRRESESFAVQRASPLKQAPILRPALADMGISGMEEDLTDADAELIPPSTPPRQPTPPRPSFGSSKAAITAKRKASAAELVDVPMNVFLSSSQDIPTHHLPGSESTVAPPRASSSARPALAGPGPASSAYAQRVQAQKAVKVDVQHSWSKEVTQKLRQVFKLPGFRTHQKEAIDETMGGKDGK